MIITKVTLRPYRQALRNDIMWKLNKNRKPNYGRVFGISQDTYKHLCNIVNSQPNAQYEILNDDILPTIIVDIYYIPLYCVDDYAVIKQED